MKDNCRDREKLQKELTLFRKKVSYISSRNGIMFVQFDIKRDIFVRLDDRGETPEHDIPLDYWMRMIHPKDVAIASLLLQVLREHQKEEYHTEYRYKFPLKHSWFAVDAAIYERDADNHPISYMCICRNVDREKNEIKRINQLRAKAEAANRMKTLFIEHLSHEIRTPLNSILGFSEMISNDLSDDECFTYKNIINTNSQLLLKIVNDSINTSLIEAGFITVRNRWFSMKQLSCDLIQSLRVLVKKDLNFGCKMTSDTMICSDDRLIHEVLNSLVINASKFTPEGSITVDYYPKDNGIYISVTDTGIGIRKADQRRIFNRFEKLDDFTQGLGLGLSLCRSIVKMMKGKIGVISELGKGSTFWFWIPCEVE